QSYIKPNQSDKHYLFMGKAATAGGILISIGTAYLCEHFQSIMDYMQLIFSLFNAPLFATFLLGMFWRRTSPWGAFAGLVSGIIASLVHLYLSETHALSYPSTMASNFWAATYAWLVCFFVTIIVSFMTKPKPESELEGLVWGMAREKTTGDL